MGSVQRLVNVTPRSAARYIAAALVLVLAIIATTADAANFTLGAPNCPTGQAPKWNHSNPGPYTHNSIEEAMTAKYGTVYTLGTQKAACSTTTTGSCSFNLCNASGTCGGNLYNVFYFRCTTCPSGFEPWNGQCLEVCPSGTTRNPTTGDCECPAGKELSNGQCLDPCPNNLARKADGTCPNCTKTAGQKLGIIAPTDYLANLQSACVNDCKGNRGPLEITVYASGTSAGHQSTQWISTGETCTSATLPTKPKLDKQIVDANVEINTDGDDTAVVKHTPTNTEVTPTVIDSQPNESYVTGNPITLIQSTPTSNPPLVQQTNNDYYTVTYYNAQGDVTNTYHIAGPQTFNITNTVNYTTVVNHSGGPTGGGDASAPPPYDGGGGDGDPPGDGGGDGDGGSGDGDGTCDPETETCSDSPVSVAGGTARTFGDSTAAFMTAVKQTPLMEAIEQATEFTQPAGSCDPLVLPFEYMGMGTVSTDIHCELASTLDMLRWVFLAIYAFMGIRIILSA